MPGRGGLPVTSRSFAAALPRTRTDRVSSVEASGLGSGLRILQVSTYDVIGGAERVAWNLFQTYRLRGHASWLAVGTKLGTDPDVFRIPNPTGNGATATRLARAASPLGAIGRLVAHPAKAIERFCGIEDFRFSGTRRLLDLAAERPDVVHCHNLHGGYFDLRALPWLSRRVPVVFTLHDAWLLSGHCAHSFACDRWKIGCGKCPDLAIYPAIRRDATGHNWRRKRGIFMNCRFYLATPSRWLMDKVEQSMLVPAIEQARVIPYGIDLTLFRPMPKADARSRLGIPQQADVVLFAANGIRKNIFKDYRAMREAIARVGASPTKRPLFFLALGESGPAERIGEAELRFVAYQGDPAVVARYYQATDVYLHGAKVDTFPNAVLEALACETPVIGSAVGGIPEQVKGLDWLGTTPLEARFNTYPLEQATGVLVAPGDAEAIAASIRRLLDDASLRTRLGKNAAEDARARFDLRQEVELYLSWYEEILCGKTLGNSLL